MVYATPDLQLTVPVLGAVLCVSADTIVGAEPRRGVRFWRVFDNAMPWCISLSIRLRRCTDTEAWWIVQRSVLKCRIAALGVVRLHICVLNYYLTGAIFLRSKCWCSFSREAVRLSYFS